MRTLAKDEYSEFAEGILCACSTVAESIWHPFSGFFRVSRTIAKHNLAKLHINKIARQPFPLHLLLYHIASANTVIDKVAILPIFNCLPKCISLSIYRMDVY